jgi:tetratricopeptide (TPR) repeat protein
MAASSAVAPTAPETDTPPEQPTPPPSTPPATSDGGTPPPFAPPLTQPVPSIDLRLDAAATMLVRGNYVKCRDITLSVLAEDPANGKARLFLALSYHKEKRYALARPIYEQILREQPQFEKFDTTYYYYGWCLYYLGELPEARAAFDQHLLLDPGVGDSYFALGLIDFEEDKLDDAEQRFLKSIELQKGDARRTADVAKAHARLADVHIRRADWAKAKHELLLCTQMHPDHYIAFFKLHTVLNRLGEPEAAATALQSYNTFKEADERRRGVQNVPQHQE